MTVRDRIIAHLKVRPEGVDDDVLADALNLSRRQHTNQECRKLERAGVVERRRVNRKIRNFVTGVSLEQVAESRPAVIASGSQQFSRNPDKPWYWEGNVQSAVAEFLTEKGYTIRQVENTWTKEQGKDIIAVSSTDRELWVSAKGRPEGTPRTTKYTQARHYFADALRDLVLWRSENKSAVFALALPDFVTYRNFARRVKQQMAELNTFVIWVFENGKVEASPNSL